MKRVMYLYKKVNVIIMVIVTNLIKCEPKF